MFNYSRTYKKLSGSSAAKLPRGVAQALLVDIFSSATWQIAGSSDETLCRSLVSEN